MKAYRLSHILIILTAFLFSCESKEREKRLYNESLAKEFEHRNDKIDDYNKDHDSLVEVAQFKSESLNAIDSILLKVEEIRAKYIFKNSKVPDKIELNLMTIEEKSKDLRVMIRHSKEATDDWENFKTQIKKQITQLNKILNQLLLNQSKK